MRGGRSLLILMVVALGLGAYIYFVESERDPTGTEIRETVFAVDRSAITGLEIRSAEAEPATLRRDGEDWSLVEPVTAPADSATIDSILSSLESIEIERVIAEDPGDLSQFGLGSPEVEVTFTTDDGTSHTLSLGSATPTGSGMYARTDDSPRLLLVPAFHRTTFDKAPFDLRNRSILQVNREMVDRITLAQRGEAALELRRDDMNWEITAPITARADASAADSLLGRLTTAQMSSIVQEGAEPTAAELRTFGLAEPELIATVGAGSAETRLALGSAAEDGSVYARDLSRPMVFTVEESLLTDLRKEPGDLRVNDLFAFNAFSALSLEVTHDGTETAYEKAPPAGDDPAVQPSWAQTRPAAGEVNQTALTDLLNALSSLRAERFVDQAPASGEDLEVAVRFGSRDTPDEERVTLRRSGEEVYAIRAGEAGAAVVPAAEFETVLSHLQTLTAAPQ